jgi:hypothetical protein
MLNELVNSVVSLTKGVARPSRLGMAIDPYSYIASTPRSTGTDTTILAFFLANNPYIQEVVPIHEFSGGGPSGEDLLLAYTPDPRVMRFELVRPFTMRPAQERNMAFVVNCHARTGGINAPYPLEMVIGETPANP